MKRKLFISSLIFIFGIGQSFIPKQLDIIDRIAPADPEFYKLEMFDEWETSHSTDYYAENAESQMISDRQTWCDDWHHWKQWKKISGEYSVYDTGMCDLPPPSFIPNDNDFVSEDAVALILST